MTLKEAESILREAGIDDPREEARAIFREVGGISQGELISLTASLRDDVIETAVRRRAAREPLAYVTGRAYFYREEYKVTPDCLIPRSDTEVLVDLAVKKLARGGIFLDLCTGSWCIALSVLNNTENTEAVCADISEGAVRVARENAEALGLSHRARILVADVLKKKIDGQFDAILSNPPYVTEKEYLGLEPELYKEPKAAFVGGEDGGDFYRVLTPLYRDSLTDEGFIAYEIGYGQAKLIRYIANQCSMSCEILRDLGGRDRVAVLRKI